MSFRIPPRKPLRVALSISPIIISMAFASAAIAQSADTDKMSASGGAPEKSVPAPTIDTNGDNKPDAWDRDANGVPDAWDVNGDGQPDQVDDNGDGKPDGAVPAAPAAEPAPAPR
jgi:hypothetical protein